MINLTGGEENGDYDWECVSEWEETKKKTGKKNTLCQAQGDRDLNC
jgi:hypothetical protein